MPPSLKSFAYTTQVFLGRGQSGYCGSAVLVGCARFVLVVCIGPIAVPVDRVAVPADPDAHEVYAGGCADVVRGQKPTTQTATRVALCNMTAVQGWFGRIEYSQSAARADVCESARFASNVETKEAKV